MTHFSHPFHRNRTYARHERWGVFGGLLALTILVSVAGSLHFSKPASAVTTIEAQKIVVSQAPLLVGTKSTGDVLIELINQQTNKPATGVWVGLRIENPLDRTLAHTYYDWYSPAPERAFFQTDTNGNVKLPLFSDKTGTIEYQIYTADPEAGNEGKYQSLNRSFSATYVEK